MPLVQTYLRRQTYEKFKRHMERRDLTFYTASAELIEKGLENAGMGEQGNHITVEEEPNLTVRVEKELKIWLSIKGAVREEIEGYAKTKEESVNQAVQDLILRGLIDFEREKAVEAQHSNKPALEGKVCCSKS